ncbi:MAG TPA: O-antigen ligase family protein [Isosphaeraceae bacterium]|jgi:hypothetical protein|nr:O-antigen ligase family protein [Isosphaeraceae bacterium]
MGRRKTKVRNRTILPEPRASRLDELEEEPISPWLGERLRRAALGLTAALLVARPFWPGEGVREAETGLGLYWVWGVVLTFALAAVSMLIAGRARLRFSMADAGVLALIALIAWSVGAAAAKRPAINLAWEWVGVGLAYLLVRNLPRTRGEATALAAALVLTAAAVSAYGIEHVSVELPATRAEFLRDPIRHLREQNITPGSASDVRFRNRLLASNEATSTFALANSLAGFLVGPAVLALAVGLEGLRLRKKGGPSPGAFFLGAIPVGVILACLIWTKSRSAYVGLAVGLLVLAWRGRTLLSRRAWVAIGVGLVVALVGLGAISLALGQVDALMVRDTPKSFRYRLEYWQGTWRAIWGEPRAWWRGFGPGNFGGAYLRHRLPESSEEIADPHNFVLEAWATAGLVAAVAVVAALAFALRDVLGPARPGPEAAVADDPPGTGPTSRNGWLLAAAFAGWPLVLFLAPRGYSPIEGDMGRWLILGGSWGLALALGAPAWRRIPTPAVGLGAGALAVVVHLLAAGGIGFTPVALGLWTLLGVGQDLRDDRPCGRLRTIEGYWASFAIAAVASALIGTFVGTAVPFWRAEKELARAETILQSRPPNFEAARQAYVNAAALDPPAAGPWLALAALEYQAWVARGQSTQEPVWELVSLYLNRAVEPPYHNPRAIEVYRYRARIARALLDARGPQFSPGLRNRLLRDIRLSLEVAVLGDPTNAPLRAEYARALADVGEYPEAVRQGEEALRLDRLTPHDDRKLPGPVREGLGVALAKWRAGKPAVEAKAEPPRPPSSGSLRTPRRPSAAGGGSRGGR